MMGRLLCLVVLCSCFAMAQAGPDDAWEALRNGKAVLLLRHATAPGLGDPPGFVLEDCATQRNLNEKGREEARRWGRLLRDRGIDSPRLLSSRWCRALETAREMSLTEVEPLPLLDSFFAQSGQAEEQTRNLKAYLDQLPASQPVVMVSHQVNITALTDIFPRSGEGVVLALPVSEPVRVLARIPPP